VERKISFLTFVILATHLSANPSHVGQQTRTGHPSSQECILYPTGRDSGETLADPMSNESQYAPDLSGNLIYSKTKDKTTKQVTLEFVPRNGGSQGWVMPASEEILSHSYSPDGSRMVIVFDNKSLAVLNTQTGETVFSKADFKDTPSATLISPHKLSV